MLSGPVHDSIHQDGLEVKFNPGKEDELTADVDNKVGRSGQAHDFASHVDGQDFGAVEPCRTVEHAIYDYDQLHAVPLKWD